MPNITSQVLPSPAIMLKGMEESSFGVWICCGEGRAYFPDKEVLEQARSRTRPVAVCASFSGEIPKKIVLSCAHTQFTKELTAQVGISEFSNRKTWNESARVCGIRNSEIPT